MVLLKSMQCCVDTVLRHHRLIRLIEMDVSPMFLALVSTDLPVWPTYTLPHSHGIQYTPGRFKPKSSLTDLSICMAFFRGIWTVLMLNLARSYMVLKTFFFAFFFFGFLTNWYGW
jgi:hypothetical protein